MICQSFTWQGDTNQRGLGAALYQKDDDSRLNVIAYGSRTLNNTAINYSAHNLEFPALKWAVTGKFYLYNIKFWVYTDHNPLVYLTTYAKHMMSWDD